MPHRSAAALLLNLGHAMDHWILVIFAYTWGVIAGGWGMEWTELTPYNYGAILMFGAGSILAGRLGDLWGRWVMMLVFFAGMGLSCLLIALCRTPWQIGVALTLMGAFASIYHPCGIPLLVQKAPRPGFTIGVNGLAGNLGIAIAAAISVFIATEFGWQSAFLLPGAICLVAALAFWRFVPRETEAPARRRPQVVDLAPGEMARVFMVMTITAITGSLIFQFTTNGNGELLKARFAGLIDRPELLALLLFAIFAIASLAQLVIGKLIDRFPLKRVFLPVVLMQVPLFLLASQAEDWVLFLAVLGFMALVFGAVPFTDAMVVKYVDDRLRSRVTGLRLAIGFGVSSFVVALIGPAVQLAGFQALLLVLAGVAACSALAVLCLPSREPRLLAAPRPAE